MDERKHGIDPSETEQTGFEQRLVSAFNTKDVDLAIELLKQIDILLSGKAQCEFANADDLANLKTNLQALFSRGKEYIFYLSDGGSRLILTPNSIIPSRNFYKENEEK